MSEDPAIASPPAPAKVRRAKRRRVPLIGPLFSWDLVRLARRGQDARSRTILSLVLFLTLLVFTVVWFKTTNLSDLFFGTQQVLDIKDSARFAEQFSLALLIAQMCVMALLTPAYAAGSVAEEKERRTWQYLLATDLTNREIVLGKYLGRVVFLLGVMCAGLPVLAITGLVGGIDPLYLLVAYILTGTTVMLLAAAGICAAIYATTFRGAMFRSYLFAGLYFMAGGGISVWLSPISMLVGLHSAREDLLQFFLIAGGYMFLQFIATVIILIMAFRRMRSLERRSPFRSGMRDNQRRKPPRLIAQAVGTAEMKRKQARWGETDHLGRKPHRSPVYAEKPRIGNQDPFTWKERYVIGSKRTSDDESIRSLQVVLGVIVAIILALVVFIAILSSSTRGNPQAFSNLLLVAGMAGVFMHFISLGPSVCGAVLRERARLTLESLLTIPVPRTSILTPKWTVNFSRGWWWGGPGMVCVVLGMLASDIGPGAFPTIAYLPGSAACCVSLGLWLSCRCHAISRAVMIYLAVASGLALVPLGVWFVLDDRHQLTAVIVMSVFSVLVAVAAWVFWRLAVREFEAYGRE